MNPPTSPTKPRIDVEPALAALRELGDADVGSTGTALPPDVRTPFLALVAQIRASWPAEKPRLEARVRTELAGTRPGSLGFHLLGSALLRVIATDKASWERTSQPAPYHYRPRPQLLAKLDDLAAAMAGGESPMAAFATAVGELASGAVDAAYSSFEQAAHTELFKTLTPDDFRGASTCRGLSDSEIAESAFSDLPEIDWLARTPLDGVPHVFSYSGDDLYVRAFAPGILASLPASGDGIAVHFHVINPSAEGLAVVDELRRAARERSVALQVSAEVSEVSVRSYLASNRFIRMREFLRGLDRDLIQLDLDTEFTGDPRAWPRFDPDSVGLSFVQGPWGGFLPWRAIWAGMVFVPASSRGMRFAETVHSVLAYLWPEAPGGKWWIDQNALFLAFTLAARGSGQGRFQSVSKEQRAGVRSGSDFKLERLSGLEPVAKLIADGQGWSEALRALQLGERD